MRSAYSFPLSESDIHLRSNHPVSVFEFVWSVRSRLADFQQNCQPSSLPPSGCLRESGAVCLKAYAGLIGEKPPKTTLEKMDASLMKSTKRTNWYITAHSQSVLK